MGFEYDNAAYKIRDKITNHNIIMIKKTDKKSRILRSQNVYLKG